MSMISPVQSELCYYCTGVHWNV